MINGWLYCIKTNEPNIYKCGYTNKHCTKQQCESKLRSRYGIVISNPEIIHLVEIFEPKEAEKDLFNKLKNIKHIREMYKTEDVNIIINAMNEISNYEKYKFDTFSIILSSLIDNMSNLPIIRMIDKIYFDKECPENHNIKLINDKLVEVFIDNKWEKRKLKVICKRVIEKTLNKIYSACTVCDEYGEIKKLYNLNNYSEEKIKILEDHIKGRLIERKNENE